MHDDFAFLHAQTREMLTDLAEQWAEGFLSARSFAEAMDEVLLAAHTRAVVIGRTHAGDTSPEEADDARFAAAIVEEEHHYLQTFRAEMESGRYQDEAGVRDGEAVARRAVLYSGKLAGSANQAFTLTLDPETLITWILGGDEGSACSDCPELADASPYTPAALPTVPGNSETLCRTNCRCRISTADGKEGFVIPD